MKALGRTLYVVGDELLVVSARLPRLGAALGNGAISIRNAGDQLLDLDWENVAGELETAAVSCEEYLPEVYFQGLVDLFSYVEPAPECEWKAASSSMYMLAGHIEAKSYSMLEQMDGRFKEESSQALCVAIESLVEAIDFFDPTTPIPRIVDPRNQWSKEGRGVPREAKTYAFPWERTREAEARGRANAQWSTERARDKQRSRQQALRQKAAAAVAGYAYATSLLGKVDVELEAADALTDEDSRTAAKRSALRRLLKDLHPDQNPNREDEVMPVFEYVQRLREEIK